MRVQVVMDKELREQLAFRNRPFMLGLVVTPIGGVVGALVAQWVLFQAAGGTDARALVGIGLLLGSILASPVTLIVLPLMHGSRPAPWYYPVGGGLGGLCFYGVFSPFPAPSGLAGGVATGLIFAVVNRTLPRAEDNELPRAANPP